MTFEEELASPENEYVAVIGRYLKDRALTDPSVAENLKKENKSLKRCFQFIIDEARKKKKDNCAMIKDDVVYGWAVHYYDEDDLDIDKNAKPEKAIEKKQEEHEQESEEAAKEVKEVKVEKKKAVKKKDAMEEQLSLF